MLRSILMALLLLISACGRFDLNMGEKGETTSDLLPFLQYKVIGNCGDSSLRFQVIQFTGIQLWTDPTGPLTVADGKLFLLQDFTYKFVYREFEGSNEVFNQTVTGPYQFSGYQFNLGDLGNGTVIGSMGGRIGVQLTFMKSLHSPALENQNAEGRLTQTTQGIQTRVDICGP